MLNIVDLYSGAGGETEGIKQAVNTKKYDLAAVDHWDIAIQTHRHNHPEARHFQTDIDNLNPHEVVDPRKKLDLLWASPECIHYSRARGGRPSSEQDRASPWTVLKWLSHLYVRRLFIENVPEFIDWGPLGSDGLPLKSKKGQIFQAFLVALKSMGYRVDYRVLNCADYGDPTTRKRFFLQAVRGRERIKWPEPTYAKIPGLFGEKPWIPARDIIDWSIKGNSIFGRKKPLKPATLSRIKFGIRKYWRELAEPFLVILRGASNTQDIKKPLPTLTTSGAHLGLVQPFVIGQQSGARPRGVESGPLPTVSTAGAISITQPFIVKYYGNGKAGSMGIPLSTVTTKDRFALVEGTYGFDILFRMLKPHELAAAQGFPSTYWFAGNVKDQVKQIGNAVPVHTAKALVTAGLG